MARSFLFRVARCICPDQARRCSYVDGIVTALVSHAVGLFLDENCGREGTLLHQLSWSLETELVAACYADPVRILAMPDDGSQDAVYARRLATEATTLSGFVVNVQGQPTAPRPPSLSLMTTLVQR
jgi:hypothetical protein